MALASVHASNVTQGSQNVGVLFYGEESRIFCGLRELKTKQKTGKQGSEKGSPLKSEKMREHRDVKWLLRGNPEVGLSSES